jgi:hypothetical protein
MDHASSTRSDTEEGADHVMFGVTIPGMMRLQAEAFVVRLEALMAEVEPWVRQAVDLSAEGASLTEDVYDASPGGRSDPSADALSGAVAELSGSRILFDALTKLHELFDVDEAHVIAARAHRAVRVLRGDDD